MSETLLAVLLVTSSAKGSNLVYHWPPYPTTHPRLARPLPKHDTTCLHADNPWRAANAAANSTLCDEYEPEEKEYAWHRSNIGRARSMSFSHARSHPSSRRASPSKDLKESLSLEPKNEMTVPDEYDQILGYSAEFLAGILCPHSAMCHQRFELVADELAFVGHPVCAESDGGWRFRAEKPKAASRGRGSKKGKGQSPQVEETSLTPERTPREVPPASAWLQTFHLVLVLDLPDPSSSASGNIAKYFEIIYEQIAFATTAVLYQEQVLHNFVETECDVLGALKDDYIKRGEPFSTFIQDALKVSSIAPAIKNLYTSIKDKTIARLTIHEFSLEIQLPPYLDALLHSDDPLEADIADRDNDHEDEYGGPAMWGADLGFAWRLPALAPWKSLLRLDDEGEHGYDLYMKFRGPQMNPEDREIAEQLIRFLDLASVTLSLADMASLLDWDLEGQVFPTVRWLVRHRRAKVVDVVHSGLKTVFTLPQTLPAPLSDLTAEFSRAFNPSLPPLPQLLSRISTSPGAHFYGAAVGVKDMLPLYHDVVIWMLKRDLLITLHLRVRIVATADLKEKVRMKRELARARRERIRSRSLSASGQRILQEGDIKMRDRRDSESKASEGPDSSPIEYWMSMSPKSARRQARQMSPPPKTRKRDRSLSLLYGFPDKPGAIEEEEDDGLLYDDDFESGADEARAQWDESRHSMIPDPARATPLERLWLAAMSDGKDVHIARRFERINQYFDGKCSDDEILYRAEISRRQLREVLHHYEEYLQTFLHPA